MIAFIDDHRAVYGVEPHGLKRAICPHGSHVHSRSDVDGCRIRVDHRHLRSILDFDLFRDLQRAADRPLDLP
jgi:hypothetical protein